MTLIFSKHYETLDFELFKVWKKKKTLYYHVGSKYMFINKLN